MNNQRHVSLTITARAPGTPQHQAVSGFDLHENAVAESTNSRVAPAAGNRRQQ